MSQLDIEPKARHELEDFLASALMEGFLSDALFDSRPPPPYKEIETLSLKAMLQTLEDGRRFFIGYAILMMGVSAWLLYKEIAGSTLSLSTGLFSSLPLLSAYFVSWRLSGKAIYGSAVAIGLIVWGSGADQTLAFRAIIILWVMLFAVQRVMCYRNLLSDFRDLEREAKAGDNSCQFYLGCIHLVGWGCKLNYAKALEWFKKAAFQGHPRAQLYVGYLSQGVCDFGDGRGLERDEVELYKWLSIAAKDGNKEAMNLRKELSANIAPENIKKAQQSVREFTESHRK